MLLDLETQQTLGLIDCTQYYTKKGPLCLENTACVFLFVQSKVDKEIWQMEELLQYRTEDLLSLVAFLLYSLTQQVSKIFHVKFTCMRVVRHIIICLLNVYVRTGLEFCQLNSLL